MPEYMPKSAQLAKIMQLVENSPEAADYFVARFEQTFSKMLSNPEVINMHQRIINFAKNSHLANDDNSSAWSARMPVTGPLAYQEALASEASQKVPELISGELSLDYAISQKSEIVRAFLADGEQVKDPQALNSLDTLLNSWLASHNIITRNGTLYDANGDGQISWDERKPLVPADPDRVNNLMQDMYQGLQRYLALKNIDLTSVNQRDFPGEEPDITEAMEVEPSQAMDIDPTTPGQSR